MFDDHGYFTGDLPAEIVSDIARPGPADDAVKFWLARLPDFLPPEDFAREWLSDTGIGREEVAAMDYQTIREYVLWLAAWDISEGGEFVGVVR